MRARCWPLVALLLLPTPARAAEPWADAKLPVTAGLELWLDAARASGATPPPHDGKLETWFDASGKARHLRQPNKDARPQRLPAGSSAVVRFDGLDDHLRAVKQSTELDTFTVVVVGVPRQNPGGFRGVLAFNAANQRDYESGLNLDFGPNASQRFNALNLEGRGFGGWKNLLPREQPFGELHTLEVVGDAKTVRVTANGATAERPRDGRPVSFDEVTVGARYYTNGPGAQKVDSFGRWDVAEVLVFSRALPAAEAKHLRDYLSAKHAALKQQLPPDEQAGSPLVLVKDPPPVQMFFPGFNVRELPVDLTNINNVLYRPDGSLIALGYNGNLWRLRDTDRDGLEDRAELIWDAKGSLRGPIGMDFLPHGKGTLVASKGRLSLITDDGRATTIAGGWPEIFPAVDTLGVAVDPRDGAVYFGRGCANFTDPYQRDKAGKAAYSLKDETGTVLRLAPDLKAREIVATGIRFPVALRFNKLGDLFATDQEGATWAPNGNPLDELLHIQKGRHYGFPSRHPTHLPSVTDEPSTFDYGPQHQSTCGFCFNEPVTPGGPTFGPKHWAGDAIVTGESRGKMYRTTLVKTPAGYVARTQLLAALNMLTVDCCVSPDGSLVVACHGGGPDWGSGPTGKGKLFKITYTDRDHPQPVLAWPSSLREVRVEFDRPVPPELLRDVLKHTTLTAGKYVRAGDRFETMWPGYAVVQMQKAAPRFDVPVRSAQLTPDRRTLVLATDRLPAAVHYALTLPGMGRPAEPPKGALRQLPVIDLDFDLTGCEAKWTADGAEWAGWLPHADLDVAKVLTAGSASHDALWAGLAAPGELTLRTKLDLTDMLRPAVQPGSHIDHDPPAEAVTVRFTATGEATVSPVRGLDTPTGLAVRAELDGGRTVGTLSVTPKAGAPVPMSVRVTMPAPSRPAVGISFTTNEDARPRPLALRRFLLSWAETDAKALGRELVTVRPPELGGGSWARGRAEFFGEQAACARCHAVHGRGGDLGPDLSNLVHRDYASVLRDIDNPSFAINPDHVASVVELKDGRTLTGVVRAAGEKLRIGDEKGVVTEVAKVDVEKLTASTRSVMPDGLPKRLGPERVRDLMTFLLTQPPRMPDYGPQRPPEPRTRAELTAVLAGAPNPPAPTRPITIVLVSGKKDHGPGEHDYPAWRAAWKELLSVAEKTTVDTADEWPSAAQLAKADVLVFYQKGAWTAERARDMDAFLGRGGGAVYVHWAVEGGAAAPAFAQRIGLASNAAGLKYRHGPLELGFDTGSRHPIGRNFDKLKLHDESYWLMTGDPKRITLLASGKEDGADRPLFWALEPAKGRVVVSIPGHFAWTFDDPLFRVLLLRSIAWAGRQPVDRFNDLATPGARLRD